MRVRYRDPYWRHVPAPWSPIPRATRRCIPQFKSGRCRLFGADLLHGTQPCRMPMNKLMPSALIEFSISSIDTSATICRSSNWLGWRVFLHSIFTASSQTTLGLHPRGTSCSPECVERPIALPLIPWSVSSMSRRRHASRIRSRLAEPSRRHSASHPVHSETTLTGHHGVGSSVQSHREE